MSNQTKTTETVPRSAEPFPAADYPDYLRDESRRSGTAESISFPACATAAQADLAAAFERGQTVTVQSARTGITAGAVPDGGHIINLSRMQRLLGLRRDSTGAFLLRTEPGVLLADLRAAIAQGELPGDPETIAAFRQQGPFWFPPDPTETSAALGGMIACNASGALTFRYGPTRNYINALRVLLPDGNAIELRRGREKASGRNFTLVTEAGRTLQGSLPSYAMPAVKSAAGLYAAPDMDMVDLFIGAEGVLGVIAEAELRLPPAPRNVCGVMAFMPDENTALTLVEILREPVDDSGIPLPAAIEFFDANALNLLRRRRDDTAAFADLPEMPQDWHTALYLEFHGDSAAELEQALEIFIEKMEAAGASSEDSWVADSPPEVQRQKRFRHALPEAVNLLIDQHKRSDSRITKLGTDLAAPAEYLRDMMKMYHSDLQAAGLEYVIFGHIGNTHVHVNILPRDMADYETGKALYVQWAQNITARGGTVSAEHGIGKLKRELLEVMYGRDGLAGMAAVKRIFDPHGRLNRGNLFVTATEQL